MSDKKKNYPRIDISKIPESTWQELVRVTHQAVIDFFSNITPEQQAHYEQWCKEYDRRKKRTNDPENPD